MLAILVSPLLCLSAPPPGRVSSLPGAASLGNATYYAGLQRYSSAGATLETFFFYVQHPDPSAPLVVWMNGGPGASSFGDGLLTELGPFLINGRSYPQDAARRQNASAYTLWSNPSAYSSEGSVLVWEQPAAVGFSRCLSGCPSVWDDNSSADASKAFLLSFFESHPEAAARDLYVTGESYAGVYVPLLATRLLGATRLRGIAVGDGCIGWAVSGGCGLDSLSIFVTELERLAPGVPLGLLAETRTKCKGQLDVGAQGPDDLSAECAKSLNSVFEEAGEYNEYHWGSPCGPDDHGNWGDGSGYTCLQGVLETYLALPEVQQQLNVISPGQPPRSWQQWDGDSPGFYNISVPDTQPAYRALIAAKMRVLIYEGLGDTAVPDAGAQKWVPRVAGAGISAARRKWGAPGEANPHAGDVTVYDSGLTYATVKGAGHMVPSVRPVAALAMMRAWLRDEPLPPYLGKRCKRLWLGRGYGKFCPDGAPSL